MPLKVVPATTPLLLGIPLLLALAGLLAVLAALDTITVGAAIMGVLTAAAASLLATHVYRRDVTAVASYIESIKEAERGLAVPAGASPTARLLTAGVARLHGDWLDRNDRLRIGLEASEQILEALHDPLILL